MVRRDGGGRHRQAEPLVKVFHCDHCGHLVFFENTCCVTCGHKLAYLPDLRVVGSLEQVAANAWRSPLKAAAGRTFRLCRNYTDEEVCNWAIADTETDPLCVSCRLTRVIPNLDPPGARQAWYRLEVAKRRLLFTLLDWRSNSRLIPRRL